MKYTYITETAAGFRDQSYKGGTIGSIGSIGSWNSVMKYTYITGNRTT
jgi:hypothetical protein